MAGKLVETFFSWCGHSGKVPQTTRPAQCPKGCSPTAGWDPLPARRAPKIKRSI